MSNSLSGVFAAFRRVSHIQGYPVSVCGAPSGCPALVAPRLPQTSFVMATGPKMARSSGVSMVWRRTCSLVRAANLNAPMSPVSLRTSQVKWLARSSADRCPVACSLYHSLLQEVNKVVQTTTTLALASRWILGVQRGICTAESMRVSERS
ncbi:hypothetical protein NEOLEDRAFT_549047 [Neolentinus lepideus HHB14362 ss-1]|uniref:Uncharacterized protein n=1 Tax=Neolentinus lepideus HHB14362 ss-1 TaxID=1314782 RepID=A0A165R8R2_9AGAM|nr:hypothetical protein NEOLEDRAFT_549047 [Neolentinus lepideus HHB14362 ss-1]